MGLKRLKAIIITLFVAIMAISPLTNVFAEEAEKQHKSDDRVKIYVFYGDGCPHCAELHSYLDELAVNKDYASKFVVVDYEVWNNEKNYNLMMKVAEKFGDNVEGVPYFIIGEKTFSGFGEDSKTEIKTLIKELYGSENYNDIVSTVGTGESDVVEEDEKDNNLVGIIILGVIAVGIILIIISSGKNKVSEEVEEAPVKEIAEVKEEIVVKKAPARKAPAKKTAAAKKAASKTTAAKKEAPAKKTATKKAASKTTAAKKEAPAKKTATVKKSTSKTTASKKTTSTKATKTNAKTTSKK